MNTRLPVVRIAEPCPMDWSAMTPVSVGVRHCDVCNLNVHDVSQMSDRQARAFIAKTGTERQCGRMIVDLDGTLVTTDTGKAKRLWPAVVMIGATLAAGTGAVAEELVPAGLIQARGQVVVGDVCPPQQTPTAFEPAKAQALANATSLVHVPTEDLAPWVKELATKLPAGVVPLSMASASFPHALPAAPGMVYLFGKPGTPATENQPAVPEQVQLVVWQMPAGYVATSPIKPETVPSVHHVARSQEGDFLTWSGVPGSELIDAVADVFNAPATLPAAGELTREKASD